MTIMAAMAVAALVAGVGACSSSASSHPASSTGSSLTGSSQTLVMESSPETAITQDFNPFATTQAAWGMGAIGLIYEPLIQFDLAAPPKDYPWLATSYHGPTAAGRSRSPSARASSGTTARR